MNQPQDLKKLTKQEIEAKLTTTKATLVGIIVMLVLLVTVAIYGLLASNTKATFIGLMISGLSLIILVIIQFSSIKKMRDELNQREQ